MKTFFKVLFALLFGWFLIGLIMQVYGYFRSKKTMDELKQEAEVK